MVLGLYGLYFYVTYLSTHFLNLALCIQSTKRKVYSKGINAFTQVYHTFFLVVTILTMFTIIAAVSIVTASILSTLIPVGIPIIYLSILVLSFTLIILFIGNYKLLDNLMKVIILALTCLTIITVCFAAVYTETHITFNQWLPTDQESILFLIAFIGWMPAPLDLSVWHSIWTTEKIKSDNATIESVSVDFNIGYWGTTFLAILFLSLGALVMHPSGQTFSPKGSVFANQLIELYTSTLGNTLGVFVGFAALITMFSTTITCLDAIPRTLCNLQETILNKPLKNNRSSYLIWSILLCIGAIIILLLFLDNMSSFLQIATILSFVTAPFFAIVNYWLVCKYVARKKTLSIWTHILSICGIIFLTLFCLYYIKIIAL